jgi:diguanylate cyclase (GGDEF)-like protein
MQPDSTSNTNPAGTRPEQFHTPSAPPPPVDDAWPKRLDVLFQQLRDVTTDTVSPPVVSPSTDNELVQVRLGIAASLFTALRCKHPPVAAHGLRVALDVSAWCVKLDLSPSQRDVIEVAALLHDLGVIGVPDQILQKPGVLDRNEAMVIEHSRQMSIEILRGACAEPAILEIVANIPAWYDGSKAGYELAGEEIPFGARMIAVVESYDSMTTDHVFRPAMSRELAMTELFACAGSQFDPALVEQYAQFIEFDQSPFRQEVANRWLRMLDPQTVESYWELNRVVSLAGKPDVDKLFGTRLLNNMYDGVVFIDTCMKVKFWNHGAERMTGISSQSITQRRWCPELLDVRDEKGEPLGRDDCPVVNAIHSGVQSLRRLNIWGRTGRPVAVDTHVIPVLADDGTMLGAILLLHDASPEISLEERCQSLHEKATKDSLTQVANRAEFDRVHEGFVTAHLQRKLPCTLIICDLDHFKQVNDTYGHQAGDDVIRGLALVLKNSCRPGDLVARYGGEEFVMLCADCDNATGVRRAEQVRQAMSEITHSRMAGRSVTASFGVTEIQPGDTAETMLRRADRALLWAKSKGRNRVVQLGTGSVADEPARICGITLGKSGRSSDPDVLLEQDLVTPVPIGMAIEKLRGFVADHRAEIVQIDGNRLQLLIDDHRSGRQRRRGDRSVSFLIKLRFEEERVVKAESAEGQPPSRGVSRTKIHVSISPKRARDRRRSDVSVRAREVLVSFRSYLIAFEEKPRGGGVLSQAKRIFAPWLAKK